jgi:hypothetical protein
MLLSKIASFKNPKKIRGHFKKLKYGRGPYFGSNLSFKAIISYTFLWDCPFNTGIVEPPHFWTAPVLGVNFDAAPAPTLLYNQANFLNQLKF